MSNTPRTDAATVRMERLDGDIDEVVSADFARTLERELIAARSATAATEPFRWLVEYPNGVSTYLTNYEYLYHDGYRTEPTKDTPLYAAPAENKGTAAPVDMAIEPCCMEWDTCTKRCVPLAENWRMECKRLERAQAAPVEAKPSATVAMVLVPREPTPEMWDAAWKSIGLPYRAKLSLHEIKTLFDKFHAAMRAAAPVDSQGTAAPVEEGAIKDAERYRWLRSNRPIHDTAPFICRNFSASFSQWTGEDADRVVDEAMNSSRMKREPVDHGYDRTASLSEGRYVCTCGACSCPDASQPSPTTKEQP